MTMSSISATKAMTMTALRANIRKPTNTMSCLTSTTSSAMSAAMLPSLPAAMRKPDIFINLLPGSERFNPARLAPRIILTESAVTRPTASSSKTRLGRPPAAHRLARRDLSDQLARPEPRHLGRERARRPADDRRRAVESVEARRLAPRAARTRPVEEHVGAEQHQHDRQELAHGQPHVKDRVEQEDRAERDHRHGPRQRVAVEAARDGVLLGLGREARADELRGAHCVHGREQPSADDAEDE